MRPTLRQACSREHALLQTSRRGPPPLRPTAAASHLDFGRGRRDHDRDADAKLRTVIREPERMIASRCRDHASGALHVVQAEQCVARATLLERARALQVITFQPDLPAHDLRKCRCNDARRETEPVRQTATGSFNFSQAEGSERICFSWIGG